MTIDLNSVNLPDLSDTTKYPTVAHTPFCTDPGPVDPRTCHPGSLLRVRPYELPTEPLGKLKFTWNRLRELIPVPPRIGVHCPTISATTATLTGLTGSASTTVTQQYGDACLPRLVQHINFPCTTITPTVSLTTSGSTPTASWAPPVLDTSGNSCNTSLRLNLNIPIGGGASTSGGGFTVGTPGDTTPPFASDPCYTGYANGDEVPVVDTQGCLDVAGTQLDPALNRVINSTKQILVKGDEVEVVKLAVQPSLPARREWVIVTA